MKIYISNIPLEENDDKIESKEIHPPNVPWSQGIGMWNVPKSQPAEKK